MNVIACRYSPTNTYLIEGTKGRILFDTGKAGTFPAFCRTMREKGIPVRSIDHILISHFHPDHMGIAQEIADLGPVITVMDVQRPSVRTPDCPVREEQVLFLPIASSRAFLGGLGIDGEILHTPGHSPDSISLLLDDGTLFAGDLPPLPERERYRGTQVWESWEQLLKHHPVRIFYGHGGETAVTADLYGLTRKIMQGIDRGQSLDSIRRRTGADSAFLEDVARMYLTHPGVSVQGILDRIESRRNSLTGP